jgi:NAD-dependent deacetylase
VQKHLGANFSLVTQNVDNLHEQAGSTNVIHMHGELFKTRCENPACKLLPFDDTKQYLDAKALPRCRLCGARLRPHIVWFGEVPFELHPIKRKVEDCALFMTVGSSGVVYPAAGFVREIVYRRQMGESCRAIYVGLERPANADQFQEVRLGKSGEVLPSLFTLEV